MGKKIKRYLWREKEITDKPHPLTAEISLPGREVPSKLWNYKYPIFVTRCIIEKGGVPPAVT
jgi:hypothetical protein